MAEAEVSGPVGAPITPVILSECDIRRALKHLNTKITHDKYS